MKKTLRILALIALVLPAPALLGNSPEMDKAVELMKLMNISKQIDASFGQVQGFADKMVDAQNLPPEQKEQAKQVARTSMKASLDGLKAIDWDSMFAEIYAKVFSVEELDALVGFYQSPIGQKFLEKQPELMAATMQRMQGEMARIMPKMQADIQAAIKEAGTGE